MQFFPKEDYKKPLYIASYILIGILVFYIFIKYVLKLILPFLIAFMIVLSLRPLINTISKKTKMPKRPVSITVVLTITAFLISAFCYFTEKIFTELRALTAYLNENGDRIIDVFVDIFSMLKEKLPFLDRLIESNDGGQGISVAAKALESVINNLASSLPDKLYRVIVSVPEGLFFAIVLIMSAVYVCADYDKLSDFADERLPKKFMSAFRKIKSELKDTAFKYLKAYVLLIFITFSELLCGFLILDIDYAFLLALIISVIDILPVLGAGTVLVPWALILYITGNVYLGTGLLIMFGVMTLLRQFIEPQIVGKSFGIHPLVMLISMYAGYGLWGITGIISFPIAAALLWGPLIQNKRKKELGT
ncbi:MAG: sporulation integral membrane protein YtvI [Ruminococcaceae bacterium]|nr:sporulation integral membrane protein YtvI [Oscillospiraceae bacterium]